MLATVCRRSGALRLNAARVVATRGLCAPAVETKLIDEVKADIEDFKAKLASPTVSAGAYTPESFEAAFKAGKVDSMMLSATMGDWNDGARKFAVKLSGDAAMMMKEMETEPTIDWSTFEGKIEPSILAQVKSIVEGEVAAGAPAEPAENAAVEKQIMDSFNGPDGLFAQAAKDEKAAMAGMEQCVTDLEKLAVDIEGVSNVTIAEILEREPELRAEIEEEISNNVWAP